MCDKLVLLKSLIISGICIFTGYAVAGQTARTMPAAYASAVSLNSIRTWDAVKPSLDISTITSQITKDVKQSVSYFDGLGRPIQTVIKQGSLETSTGNNVDLINAADYDDLGREVYKYLPFASTATDGTQNNGLFKLNPFQQQAAFYDNAYTAGPIKGQGETFFYGKVSFEPSPLNRVQESFAAGNSWAGTSDQAVEANRRSVKMKYYLNTAIDAVRIWTVTNNPTTGQFGSYASAAAYPAGQLYKNVTADEQGNQVIEFKDKDGKVILKKVQLTAAADDGTGSGHTGWLCTYYIYDDLNLLRCVIQPRGVELVAAAAWALTDPTILAEQCFRYEYDDRNHIIVKKVPGAGEVYMVYDAKDRLVLMQDANMRTGTVKWMYTQYDVLNRPIVSGLWNDANSFLTHYNAAHNSSSYPTLTGTTEELTRTFYDNYDWRASWGSPLTNTYNSAYNTYFQTSSNIAWPYPQANVQSTQITGLATGTRIKVIGTASAYLFTVNIYDAKGRLIQVQTQNNTGGTDIATTQYSWAGQPLITVLKQEKAGVNAQTTVLVTQLTYDDLGRLIKTEKKLSNTQYNSNAMSAYVSIAENQYNAIGQLKTKKLAPAYNGNAGIETLNYDYNIRGWMLGENRDYAKTSGSTTNYFGFDLGYDKNAISPAGGGSIGTYATPAYNGNIEGMVWKSKGDGEIRKYDFNYDIANRILKADFNQYTGGAFNKTANVDFSMMMGDGISATSAYDANGNIISMNQNGLKLNASSPIDQLSYTYQPSSNKLSKVVDAVNDNTSTLGDFKYDAATKGATDYSYDVNGNLTLDNNKKISNIAYNYLNLPSFITVTGKGSITYTYDATGNKQKKVTVDNSIAGKTITTTTTYINNFVYESKTTVPIDAANPDYADVLQFTGHEEGRIRRKTDGTFAYDYFLKDHLGNVRMVLTDEQQTDIYPAATLETSKLTTEQAYYNINTGQIVDKSSATGIPDYQNNNVIPNPPVNASFDNANSAKIYKLNKNTQNMGLGITLRVMSGDKIDIYGKSYYFQNNTGGTTANTDLTTLNILTGLLGGPTGAATNVHGAVTATQLNGITNTTNLINTLLNNQTTTNNANPQVPKAFINYILFDEQFKSVGSGFAPVGANSVLTDYASVSALHNIPVVKNGFVYIYCSNESPVDVFFDNLQVVQTRGPILEETHYYPFGLTMAGISSQAVGGLENKYKYNKGSELQNKEFSDGSGLELYATNFRSLDPQLGRWWQIDPKPDYAQSLYSAMGNNPILRNDPLGDTSHPSLTAAVTFGSISLDFKVEGTPLTVGTTFRNGENDFIGMRNSHFVFMGADVYNKNQVTSTNSIGANVLGFGIEKRKETKRQAGTPVGTITSEEVKVITTTPISSTETIQGEGGKKSSQSYIGLSFKAAIFLGIELEIKIPIGPAGPIAPLPIPKSDATYVKPKPLTPPTTQ